MKANDNTGNNPLFPVPLDKIANDFHLTVEEVESYLKDLGAEVGYICGRPAVEPHYYVLAFLKSYQRYHTQFDSANSVSTLSPEEPSDEERVDQIISTLKLEADDSVLIQRGRLSIAQVVMETGLPDSTVRRMLGKKLYLIPGTSPKMVCAKSVVLHLHETKDPRVKDGSNT